MQAKDRPEKREFIRVAVNAELRFGPSGGPLSQHGYMRNLSANGIQFETRGELATGVELEIEVLSKNGRVPPLRARVRVIRVERGDEGQRVAAEMLEVR
jgi:hypothetical protein